MAEPPAADAMPNFTILSGPSSRAAPRLGRLALPHRTPIQTPNFLSVTSRGAVPHVTPDVQVEHMSPGALYMAYEDCQFHTSPLPPWREEALSGNKYD
jgi:queuine tRNA-ribosyltransferase